MTTQSQEPHSAPKIIPQRQLHQPGEESEMIPPPESFMEGYKAAGKLEGKIALVTGGDSGIGRAVCIAFAKEGADVAFIYLSEDKDAEVTAQRIEGEGRRCLKIRGDIGDKEFCDKAVEQVRKVLGDPNILVNNAAEQHVQKDVADITPEQLEKTFRTNVFGAFYMTQAVVPHMRAGDAVINTSSITAYRGHAELLDYSATKGALVAFTRGLSANLVDKKIRVNAVAPGPIWTPLIPSSFDAKHVSEFGQNSPMGRPGQPDEVAPCFVFLASSDSSYMTGQVLHPNGGTVING
jgi:NAD(P)-dependent dehydrogenase (short-subunit alcohol dehydrogenase family)